MIGVCIPSRGMIFTEVEDALSRELLIWANRIYRSYSLPIPDSHNALVEKALADGCKWILFIEEDTVIPEGGLKRLLMADSDIACIDYGVNGYSCITKNSHGEILWCGLGCTLVKSKVFDKLDKPYFRSDKGLLLNDWPKITWINTGAQAYGGQDIYFCMKAREAGFKIKQVEGECKHLRLEEFGKPEINKGLHSIGIKEPISKRQVLN